MLLAVVCVAVVMGMGVRAAPTAPPRCCFEKEFTATLGEVGARVTDGHSSTFTGTVEMAYDFYRKRIRSRSQIVYDGTPSTITSLADYVNRIQYSIPALGQCTMKRMKDTDRMFPPCLPADAQFLGHATFGYGSELLETNSWQFLYENTSMVVKVAMTEECVPVFESFSGKTEDEGFGRSQVATEVTLFYTGYNPGIDDMSTLDPPDNCVMVTDDNTNTGSGSTGGNRPVGRRTPRGF